MFRVERVEFFDDREQFLVRARENILERDGIDDVYDVRRRIKARRDRRIRCVMEVNGEVGHVCRIEQRVLRLCRRARACELVDQHLLVRRRLLDRLCEGEQLLLRDALVRLAAQEQVERAEPLVHVALREEACHRRTELRIGLPVEEIEHRAAYIRRLEAQQGGDVALVARDEVPAHETLCCLRCRAERVGNLRIGHRRRWVLTDDPRRCLGSEAQEIDECLLLHGAQRCLEEERRNALPGVADREDGRNAVSQRTVRTEGSEHHCARQILAAQGRPVPRENAPFVLLLALRHLGAGAFAEVEETRGLLCVREIRLCVELLDEVVELPQDVEIARHIGQIAGDFLHVRRTEFRVRDAEEDALGDISLGRAVLQGVQEVRDEEDGVRTPLPNDLLHGGDEILYIVQPLAPQPDHRLDIVLAVDEGISLRGIAQHVHDEREELLVHALAVRTDADGRRDGAAHGRETDEILLLDQPHDVDEMLLPPAVHRLADRLPQTLLQFPREEELADKFCELRIACLEDGAEHIVGEDFRVVLAEQHLADDGEDFLIAAVNPHGDLLGHEEAAAVLFHIVGAAQNLRHGQSGETLANQPLHQRPDAPDVLMIVVRADETTRIAARVGIVGEIVCDSDEILPQRLAHHEVKGGVERGRQDIIVHRTDHVLLVAAEIRHNDIPVIVGFAFFVRTEKEKIQQFLALLIQRGHRLFQLRQKRGHVLIAQIPVDHRIPPVTIRQHDAALQSEP